MGCVVLCYPYNKHVMFMWKKSDITIEQIMFELTNFHDFFPWHDMTQLSLLIIGLWVDAVC